ncbi:hypothetical protein A6P39_005475 [Streptomyces sp. FXJ1.172]|uniref:hypothetical protein n=1 Tax=Streptomyces sp. FXJ1.172 TaxID=710705 RepID=UPI0007D00DC8|nr:hypothetical protein [Streptomyces sp. FXJ1.172]WEO93512.1 hypothetical protein A6P39_005475 [Streptomyces sp. FXJ1.172]
MTGSVHTEETLAHARAVADAVLYEGYVLYPYRASAAKNRLRWQFGVLSPPALAGEGETCELRAQCLLEPRRTATVDVELRFLRVRRRTVERLAADGTAAEVPELELPDRILVPWDEGEEEQIRIHLPARVPAPDGEDLAVAFDLPAATGREPVTDASGRTVGRLVRRTARVTGTLVPALEELPGPYRALRLTVTVRNTTPVPPAETGRSAALAHAMIGTHLLLSAPGGHFLSMTDPPEWARAHVAACHNDHTWPVLAGEGREDDVVLSAPIILQDHPALAEESPGPLYDATEIDEILSLRTAALTDREKREARGTDPRAAEVIDLVDSMPPAVRERLHGTIRALQDSTAQAAPPPGRGLQLPGGTGHPWWDPQQDPQAAEAAATVVVDGVPLGAGSVVVLAPGARRTDAQDAFLRGRHATVEAVVTDLDGETHLAVVLRDDPGTDVRRAQGRFLYFRPDEVRPLTGEGP